MKKQGFRISLKWVIASIAGFLVVFAIAFGSVFYLSYRHDIKYSATNSVEKVFVVEKGDTINAVAKKLADADLIKSANSFKMYANFNKKTNIFAGTYNLSSSMTIPEIADILVNGQSSKVFNVTFLPGGTVDMAKKVLLGHGFLESEINQAMTYDYSNEFPQLFQGKPANADLEGFLFGETYQFEKNTDIKTIIRRFLGRMQTEVVNRDLASKFADQGLNLYEGITLASIVQKEVPSSGDQKEVAAVFYNRMRIGMNLGSDVTYQYIADKTGIPRDFNLDSPYNLRIYTGLTPTPIATPGISALEAVASPAKNNYLFFLSGDDDKTYFGTTSAEHERNIINHCQKKCKII